MMDDRNYIQGLLDVVQVAIRNGRMWGGVVRLATAQCPEANSGRCLDMLSTRHWKTSDSG